MAAVVSKKSDKQERFEVRRKCWDVYLDFSSKPAEVLTRWVEKVKQTRSF